MAKKPRPIKKTVVNKPAPKKKQPVVAAGINDVSPITDAQIRRAEGKIDSMQKEIDSLKKQKRTVQVTAPEPKVEVNIPRRPRIAKVTVKYDTLGYPSELIPVYDEAT